MKLRKICLALLGLGFASGALCAEVTDLRSAVENTVVNNPEVQVKWRTFRQSTEEIGIGRSEFFPIVDVNYKYAHEDHNEPPLSGGNQDFDRYGWSAALQQNLFKGFSTVNLVRQLDHTRRASYFDFLSESENQALEATRAYLDVLRYRQLLELAQYNYAVHKGIHQQLMQKVAAGVGRRVDLEQATGRLALAESNLITEEANLHDVTVRFTRIVGMPPPMNLSKPAPFTIAKQEPSDMFKQAFQRNPQYLSAVESVRAATAEVDVRKGAFSPTADLRAQYERTNNLDGVGGVHKIGVIEVVLNMNLFRGGADRARLRASAERREATRDLQLKACRDIHQTVQIAYNDIRRIGEQIDPLRLHSLSTEKARDAYRSQFEIGQRTLLDLLDSENELYDAKRAVVNAESDLLLAQARQLASSGLLLETLEVKPKESLTFDGSPSDEWQACDTSLVPSATIDKNAIQPVTLGASTTMDAPPAIVPEATKPQKAPAKKSTTKKSG
ncbi:TolC family outer membrane protein [Pseudogulbenkiania ferrooxidans]|uniref:Type I secretion outer membrane protein, TolC family n=1 Tax=Pseudogulbenkiania ferrooxidans 2002 TaxID=279714 RepID=B9YYD2_9NEIS|nr:TolC family outer membrane protein [Pseudogulbenkiania ferrooxidans]EEG10135.1 type I secretion outer membrane protein, TolC family [Pseudogulbenkiania ferrooxidans 2002]